MGRRLVPWQTSYLRKEVPTTSAVVTFAFILGCVFAFAGTFAGLSDLVLFGRATSRVTMAEQDGLFASGLPLRNAGHFGVPSDQLVEDAAMERSAMDFHDPEPSPRPVPPMTVCMLSPTEEDCVQVPISFGSSPAVKRPGTFAHGNSMSKKKKAPQITTRTVQDSSADSQYVTPEGLRQAPHTPVSVGGTSRARHSAVHDLLLSSQPGGSIRSTAKNYTRAVIRDRAVMESQSESVSDETAPPLKTDRILATPSDVIPSVVSRSRALGTEFAGMDVFVVTPAEPVAPESTEFADMEVVPLTPTAPVAPTTRKVSCCKVRFPPQVPNHVLILFFML